MIWEQFKKDGDIVTLEWMQENSFYSHHVSAIPPINFSYVESSGIQLNVSYSTSYNVSIAVVHQCGQNETTFIELNYKQICHKN